MSNQITSSSGQPVQHNQAQMHNRPPGIRPATAEHGHGNPLLLITLGALGVVYGDIGTSPLYAFRESFHGHHAYHRPNSTSLACSR